MKDSSNATEAKIFHVPTLDSCVVLNIAYGKIYWGKVSGYPAWPCKPCYITETDHCFSRKKKSRSGYFVEYYVRFFGDSTNAWLTERQLTNYKKGELFDEKMKKSKISIHLKQAIDSANLNYDQTQNEPKVITAPNITFSYKKITTFFHAGIKKLNVI